MKYKRKEGTGGYYRKEGKKVVVYPPGSIVEMDGVPKGFEDGFEKLGNSERVGLGKRSPIRTEIKVED